MKSLLTLALLAPSLALAVDFDLRPLDKGGNADMTMLAWKKTLAKPKDFLGKTVRILVDGLCLPRDITGVAIDGKIQSFDGVSCTTLAGESFAVAGDLKVRDSLKQKKIREIQGSIVGINETDNIIIKPIEMVAK